MSAMPSQPRLPSVVAIALTFALAMFGMPARAADASSKGKDKPKEITFDTIKLELKKDEPYRPEALTEAVKKLEKTLVRIRGYILPGPQEHGIQRFVLMRDNQECCFGPGAALHDAIMVDLPEGKTTDYTTRPVTVEGVFSLREVKLPDGKYLSIYRLDGRSVK